MSTEKLKHPNKEKQQPLGDSPESSPLLRWEQEAGGPGHLGLHELCMEKACLKLMDGGLLAAGAEPLKQSL